MHSLDGVIGEERSTRSSHFMSGLVQAQLGCSCSTYVCTKLVNALSTSILTSLQQDLIYEVK